MSKFTIIGDQELKGEIKVSGSKNAVLALMSACLLSEEECVLENVPKIRDVETMVEIFKDLGVEVFWQDHVLKINAKNLNNSDVRMAHTSRLRGSVLLLGPLLSRKKAVNMSLPGGDLIGKRPLDAHLTALQELGARIETKDGITVEAQELVGTKVVLVESSVTATENVMMAAVTARGLTTIKLAAMEPHVQQLGDFLNLMGGKVSGHGTPNIVIEGVDKLHGATIRLIPDSEEAASFITLAAANKSNVTISKLNPDYLEDFLLKLRQMHVQFKVGPDFVEVLKPTREYVANKIQCGLYPKLNSDFVPPMAVLATQARGETFIYEWLYENRLGYVPELAKMGAKADVLDPHRVRIIGPTKLKSAKITSYDLRMGITLVIAALVAEGRSEIENVEHIDRGYENLEERLRAIGASIERIN